MKSALPASNGFLFINRRPQSSCPSFAGRPLGALNGLLSRVLSAPFGDFPIQGFSDWFLLGSPLFSLSPPVERFLCGLLSKTWTWSWTCRLFRGEFYRGISRNFTGKSPFWKKQLKSRFMNSFPQFHLFLFTLYRFPFVFLKLYFCLDSALLRLQTTSTGNSCFSGSEIHFNTPEICCSKQSNRFEVDDGESKLDSFLRRFSYLRYAFDTSCNSGFSIQHRFSSSAQSKVDGDLHGIHSLPGSACGQRPKGCLAHHHD